MAQPQSDFKITFSVDLTPYVAGLKSMLTLTQQTCKQIQPLLNMQVQAPDFTPLDEELARSQEGLKKYAEEVAQAASGEMKLVPAMDQEEKKAKTSGGALD